MPCELRESSASSHDTILPTGWRKPYQPCALFCPDLMYVKPYLLDISELGLGAAMRLTELPTKIAPEPPLYILLVHGANVTCFQWTTRYLHISMYLWLSTLLTRCNSVRPPGSSAARYGQLIIRPRKFLRREISGEIS